MGEQNKVNWDFVDLFDVLKIFPGLQRKEWELNQSGVDRGLEAVMFSGGTPRELATYAIANLKLVTTPKLFQQCTQVFSEKDIYPLTEWGILQGRACKTLAHHIKSNHTESSMSLELIAAVSTLAYYRCRDDDNPAVKTSWSEDGLNNLASIDILPLVQPPIHGGVWQKRLVSVQQLVAHIRATRFETMTDTEAVTSLRSVPNIGEQLGAQIALFWLQRPVPILDTYLVSLLRNHHLLPKDWITNKGSLRSQGYRILNSHLLRGSQAIERQNQEWLAWRVLSCLYLWMCEIGRFHCRCKTEDTPGCPLNTLGMD